MSNLQTPEMHHKKFKSLLIFYAEGSIAETLSNDLEIHLGQCQECQRELKVIQNTLDLIPGQQPNKNPFFFEKIKQRMEQQAAEKHVFQWQWKPSFAIASLVVGVTFGILFGNFVDYEPVESGNEIATEEIYLDEFISQAELMIEE